MTKKTATATATRTRVHVINADLIQSELVNAAQLVAGVVSEQGEYAQGNIRVARVGGRVAIVATARGEHGGEGVVSRRGVEGDSAHSVAAYDFQVIKGAEVSARKNDRNKAIVSEAMERLPKLEAWIKSGKQGKRPCAKLTGKHYAVCMAENNKHAERVLAVVKALTE